MLLANKPGAGAFRTRDLVALAAAGIAFFFATQSQPDATLRLKWFLDLPPGDSALQVAQPSLGLNLKAPPYFVSLQCVIRDLRSPSADARSAPYVPMAV